MTTAASRSYLKPSSWRLLERMISRARWEGSPAVASAEGDEVALVVALQVGERAAVEHFHESFAGLRPVDGRGRPSPRGDVVNIEHGIGECESTFGGCGGIVWVVPRTDGDACASSDFYLFPLLRSTPALPARARCRFRLRPSFPNTSSSRLPSFFRRRYRGR